MIQINNAVISNDALEMLLDIQTSVGSIITSVVIWNQDQYKRFDEKIDLSHKLEQINNRESLSFTRDDANVDNFEGIWFIDIESNAPPVENCTNCYPNQMVIITNFNHIYRCMARTLNKIDYCNGSLFGQDSCCNPSDVNKVMTTHILLEGVKANLNIGEYALAIDFYKRAKAICLDCREDGLISPKSPCLTCN